MAGDLPLPWPLPDAFVALGMQLGLGALSALRWSVVLALLAGTIGVYTWLRHHLQTWSAVAGALLWLYAPYTLALVYRLGYVRELWGWAVAAWGLALLGRRGPRLDRWGGYTLPLAALAWGLPWLAREWTVAHPWLGAITLLGAPFAAWFTERLSPISPLHALMLTAVGAQLVVPAVQPTYIAYEPPPKPTAVFQDATVLLLEAQPQGPLRAGAMVQVAAYWQVLRPQRVNWTVFVQVLDDNNRIWGQFDGPVGGIQHPMSTWRPGETLGEMYTLTIAPGAPARLRLIMGLYNLQTMQRLPLDDGRDHVVVATAP